MLNRLKIWMVGIVSFSIGSVFAQTVTDPYALAVENKIRPIMQKYHIPGMAVELYVNGQPHEYYFGVMNRDTNEVVTRKTVFELGSVSKIMTSLLIAQEIDWAKMRLTDPITKYIKELPKPLEEVTLQDLATHTSGLPLNLPHDMADKDEALNYFAAWKPEYDPEDQWIYSNVGMGLLGYAAEVSAEMPYDKLYFRHIMLPLKMVNGVNVPAALNKYYAQGYDKHDQRVAHVNDTLFPAAYGVKASASDMQKFLSAAIGLPGTPNRILYPMRLTQSVFLKVGNDFQGLGWQIHPIINGKYAALLKVSDLIDLGPIDIDELYQRPTYDGDALIDKTGTTDGFRSYVAVLPNKKSGIVMLANKNIPNTAIVKPARELLLGFVKN